MTILTDTHRHPAFTMGDRLRKAREISGLDRQAFAEKIGVHRDSVAAYESERTRPRLPVITTWAMATGVDVQWLKTGDESTGPNPENGGRLGESNPRPIHYKLTTLHPVAHSRAA